MRCPFPGMDPYLERRSVWEDVHNTLVLRIRDAIAPALDPRYYVALQERIVLVQGGEEEPREPVGKPDLTVAGGSGGAPARSSASERGPIAVRVRLPVPERTHETYLEIRTPEDARVVTVIELLSLSNKLAGEQRVEYLRKRSRLLASPVHLVEIDLLRAGRRLPLASREVDSDYAILLSRAGERPDATLLPFQVSGTIPDFAIPLDEGEPEPEVALGRLFHDAYESARYNLRIDYGEEPPSPAFDAETREWIRRQLRAAGVVPG